MASPTLSEKRQRAEHVNQAILTMPMLLAFEKDYHLDPQCRYSAMLEVAPQHPAAKGYPIGLDGCGKPLCGLPQYGGDHHPLCSYRRSS